MLRQLTAGIALASIVALPAMGAPVQMSSAQLDEVVAGTDCTCGCPTPAGKGNNGWGNGADPSNPGSGNGGTAPSKTSNGSEPGAGKPNTNPTGSSGR